MADPAVKLTKAAVYERALRRIAEGNLGDLPWQANYDRIRAVALDALKDEGEGRG